jgi:nicotinamidase-related amidase
MVDYNVRFGAIEDNALHVAIDMQRIFAEPGRFYCEEFSSIVPVVSNITAHKPENTVFTRFVDRNRDELPRTVWQENYRQWVSDNLETIDKAMFDIVAPLLRFIPPVSVVDKHTYSAFESQAFVNLLKNRQPDTLIFTGVKTNFCVLATVLASVDRCYRTLVVTDGVTGSSVETQLAVMKTLLPRFEQQIELVSADNLLSQWK